MKKLFLPLLIFVLFCFGACEPEVSSTKTRTEFRDFKISYPASFSDTTIKDNYYGVMVGDPYRWLEKDSDLRGEWTQRQQSITSKYLDAIPYRAPIKKRLESLWNYQRISNPEKVGDYYYYFKNDGLQNQSVMYRCKTLDGELERILDPNNFSDDGSASIGNYSFSKDGSLLAYQVSTGGADWRTIQIVNLKDEKMLADTLSWVKFSGISWFRDGFFYSRYSEPEEGEELSGSNEFHQIYYHNAGTLQEDDELVFADRSNPKRNFYTQVTQDERFLVIRAVESTSGNALYLMDLASADEGFIPVVEEFEHNFEVVGSFKDNILVLTNKNASNKKIIQINASKSEENYWEEIVSPSDDVLQSAQIINGKIVALYIHNASSQLKVFSLQGEEEGTVALPDIGTITEIKGRFDDVEAFFSFSTFTKPESIYRLDLDKFTTTLYNSPEIDFDSELYETKQIWYSSYDGTKIPMFIIHKKGLNIDGNRPTLLYGYGGFDISVLPQFNRTRLNLFPIILENDGICVVVNTRGGGEFGTEWHKAGILRKKQKVFDDFQSAAEFLIRSNYTSSEKLAIYGRSNGGLLVGACMTQRPDLFKVALPAVGVMDMLRYHKFTIGWAWATDYGTSDDPEEFDNLLSYSPVHNVEQDNYPATFVTTADHDDRVVPMHSYKFIAELQEKQQGKAPVLIRIDTSSGHGAGKSTAKTIDEAADVLTFLFYNLQEEVHTRTR